MNQPKDNKYLDEQLTAAFEACLRAGFWPEVRYQHTAGMRSYSLFEYADIYGQWRLAAHTWLLEHGYPAGIYTGIYTVKRSKDWQQLVDWLVAAMTPAASSDLQPGRRLLLHNPFGRGPRYATVEEAIYMSGCIFDITTEERNGCVGETGSAYIWEVRCVEIDGVWRPLALTAEERAMEEQLMGGNMGAARVAGRLAGM